MPFRPRVVAVALSAGVVLAANGCSSGSASGMPMNMPMDMPMAGTPVPAATDVFSDPWNLIANECISADVDLAANNGHVSVMPCDTSTFKVYASSPLLAKNGKPSTTSGNAAYWSRTGPAKCGSDPGAPSATLEYLAPSQTSVDRGHRILVCLSGPRSFTSSHLY